MVWKWASLIPDALERSIVIWHGHVSAFLGHSVMFGGNNNNNNKIVLINGSSSYGYLLNII